MTVEEFSAGDWIDRLAQALPDLAEEQKPYLSEYYKHNPRAHFELRGRGDNPQISLFNHLRDLYAMAYNYAFSKKDKHYAALNEVMKPSLSFDQTIFATTAVLSIYNDSRDDGELSICIKSIPGKK